MENEYVLADAEDHVQIGYKILAAHWRPKLIIKKGRKVCDVFAGKLGVCVRRGQIKKKKANDAQSKARESALVTVCWHIVCLYMKPAPS